MHVRHPSLASPLAALSLSLGSLIAVGGCGIWPDFKPRDAGIDVTDGMVMMGDGSNDTGPVDVVHGDVPPDTGPFGGFMHCSAPSATSVFTMEQFGSLAGGERDLAFDGHGNLVSVGSAVELYSATGMGSIFMTTPPVTNGLSVRMAPDGHIVVTTGGVGVGGAISLVDAHGVVTTPMNTGLMFPASLAVHPSGWAYVSDTFTDSVVRVNIDGTHTTLFTMMGLHPTGLAITPDARHLYVASSSLANVYQIDLAMDGTMMGTPTVYANEVLVGSGMAFDQCGYLYISDRDRMRILRVVPRGPMVEVLTLGPYPSADGGMGTFAPSGVAFGHGGGFDPMSLYVVDVGHNTIVRIPVGVPGATIAGP
jgi:sugar lactone lactonase YvrE